MPSRHRTIPLPRLLGVLLTVSLTLWSTYLLADGNGRTGVSTSTNGCNCHGSSPNAAGTVSVSITGPQTVGAGTTSDYTLSVSGGPSGTTGGFDLSANGGTLVAGTGDKLSGGELTHSNNSRHSWTYRWTAPSTPGTYRFAAVGMTSNGSGSGGDSWNWYGGSASAPFTITVGPMSDTTPPAAVRDLR